MHYKWFLKPMTPTIIICFHIMVPLKTIGPVTSVVFNVMFGAFGEESYKFTLGGLSAGPVPTFDKFSWESGKNRKLLEKCAKLGN